MTYNTYMEKLNGPFGALRPIVLSKTSEAKLQRLHCYGYLNRVGDVWVLNERGASLYYFVS